VPLTLFVPVHLDALHLTGPTLAVAPTLAYDRLPRASAGDSVRSDRPFLASALPDWLRVKLEPGIHLHWSMPDALTRQRADGRFPALPNRWVVRRTGGGLGDRTWLLESDAVQFGSAVPTGAWRGAAILSEDGDRLAWLGRTTPLGPRDQPSPELADALRPFTINIGGEMTFAALYPRCRGSFGLHDGEIGGDVPPGLRYLVYGFHSRVEDDPLRWSSQEELKWKAYGPGAIGQIRRSMFVAALDFPVGTPRVAGAGSFPVEVALGGTADEALGALEAQHDPVLEEALASMVFLAESRRTDTDLQRALAEHRHTSGFHATVGEARWVLRPVAGAAQDSHDAASRAGLVEAFRTLTELQRRYDAGQRQITSLRRRLFDQWCRYLRNTYPMPGTPLGDIEDVDDLRQEIEADLLGPLAELGERVGRVVWPTDGHRGPVQPRVDPARPGLLAHGLVEAWRAAHDALSGAYELVLAPGARYWQPRELSVALRGEAVEPSNRHNADGRLDSEGNLLCPFASLPGPTADAKVRDEILGLLDNLFRNWARTEEPSIGFSRVRAEPWHPLLLDWAVDHEALGSDRSYPPAFLTDNFRHDSSRPELVGTSADTTRGRSVPLRGWSVLTRGAQRTLSAAIRRYIAELAQHAAEPPGVVSRLAAAAERLEADPPVLSCTLNGLDDALAGRRRGPQLPVRDPYELPDSQYSDFAARVAAEIGQGARPGSAADPSLDRRMLRTGFLRVDGLRAVGNFGTVRPLYGPVYLPVPFPKVTGDDHAFLPPRLLRPSRLRFRWLDASVHNDTESTDHPSTSPVQGWLVLDTFDARILAFDGTGARLGALEVDGAGVVWTPTAPWPPRPVLARVLERIRAGAAAGLNAFVQTMLDGLDAADPIGASRHRSLALLVSRPIAVTCALLDLEFAHTDTDDVTGVGDVAVPVRLGDLSPEDGLLGYWAHGSEQMQAPKAATSDAPPVVVVTGNGAPVGVTMLVEPAGQIHAVSGVLPTKRLALDPAHVASALADLQVSFRAGPILTRPGHIDHVEPSDPELGWRWIDDDASANEVTIEPLHSQAPIPAELELRRGFLRLLRRQP